MAAGFIKREDSSSNRLSNRMNVWRLTMIIFSFFNPRAILGAIILGLGLLVASGIGRFNVQADETMVEVVIVLTKKAMHTGKDEAIAAIEPHVVARGYELASVHPDVEDDELGRYLHVLVPNMANAGSLAEQLLSLPSVDAAYAKPSAALP